MGNKGYELVNFCEFDKYATKSYCAIHSVSEELNLGDITQVNEKAIGDFNMMVGGSPCQDFSLAGQQKGAMWTCKDCNHKYNPLEAHYTERDKCPECKSTEIEKTRSSLIVEWLRILREKKPNFAMYENVKNLVGKQFKPTFDLFEKELNEYGYNTYWKVLNAIDYGIPQNRERVYLIIIKKDLDNKLFDFPNIINLKHCVSDFINDDYRELTEDQINSIHNRGIQVRSNAVVHMRLMGFENQDCEILKETGISDTQLYKQAGNSIVVDVLYYILLELYNSMPYLFDDLKLSSFFSGIGAFEKALDRLFKDDYFDGEDEMQDEYLRSGY